MATRAERLDALVKRVAPKKVAYYDKHGVWPGVDDDAANVPPEEGKTVRRNAPYEIKTLAEDRRRLSLTTDDGEVISGAGANIEEAIAAVEGKLA